MRNPSRCETATGCAVGSALENPRPASVGTMTWTDSLPWSLGFAHSPSPLRQRPFNARLYAGVALLLGDLPSLHTMCI